MISQIQAYIDALISAYLNNVLAPLVHLSDSATFFLIAAFLFTVTTTWRVEQLLPGQKLFILRLIRFAFGTLWFWTFLAAGAATALMVPISYTASQKWRGTIPFWTNLLAAVEAKASLLMMAVAVGLVLAIIGWLWVGRTVEPRLQGFVDRRSLKNADGFVDVRDISAHLPKSIDFQPEAFFRNAGKKSVLFLGVDEHRKPVSVPRSDFMKSNIQFIAPPGRGKGVCAGVVLTQCIQNFDDGVVVIDPKNDEWAPSVLAAACAKMGRPFQVLDLRQGTPPQFNPVEGVVGHQLYELVIASFGLGKRGTEADYYRLGDRRIARMLAAALEEGDTLVSLYTKAKEIAGEDGDGFLKQLEELASLSCLQTKSGIDVGFPIEEGGCLYVIGSMRDETVMQLQKLVFVRVLQLVEARQRGGRHVSIFADEWKYLVSAPTINALGTVRDKGCNILIAHQSLGDLRQVGQDLDPDAAATNVIDNTPIKWVYRPSSFDVAEWASLQTGKIVVQQKSRTQRLNQEGAEVAEFDSITRDTYQQKFDTNVILNLPDACALCLGVGPARLTFSRPIKVEKITPVLFSAKPSETLSERVSLAVDPWSNAI
ncbi:MAG: type IV secretory system conjugative DNA transfer family protein [Alphaproteobacteria bacterium]|nr:type IV secretory system conjugative DNA transfer family protein [Alphaproteobacteria bacterium]